MTIINFSFNLRPIVCRYTGQTDARNDILGRRHQFLAQLAEVIV